jgi:predicted nucleic acid-binding protein
MEQRYYFDANALVKYYHPFLKHDQEEEGILQIRRLVSNSPEPILISPLTSQELIGKLTQFFRKKSLKRKRLNTIITLLKKDISRNRITTRPFQILAMPDNAYRLAEIILLEHVQFAISANDALHLAIVQSLPSQPEAVMVTSDHSLQRVCERTQISFYDPEVS